MNVDLSSHGSLQRTKEIKRSNPQMSFVSVREMHILTSQRQKLLTDKDGGLFLSACFLNECNASLEGTVMKHMYCLYIALMLDCGNSYL